MDAEALLRERSELLARLNVINQALKDLEAPTKAIPIDTRRNLRNTYLPNVTVYADEAMTKRQSDDAHSGFVSAAGAAKLRAAGDVDGDYIRLG
jgi:hypothetical protein